MDKKTQKDVYSILSILGFDKSEAKRYLIKTAQITAIDLSNPSQEEIQALLQSIILDYEEKKLGFRAELDEEPQYLLLGIKDVIPEFDYQNLNIQYFLDGKKVKHYPVEVDNDFEISVEFSCKGTSFNHKYSDTVYVEELVMDVNREILIPKFNLRFYSLLNSQEIIIFALFPSSVTPEEFFKFSKYL